MATVARISQVVLETLSEVIQPTEAEFLSDAMGVLTWIEWTHVDNTGTTKTLVFSKVPLADSGV